jgi:hypothetical protein
MSISTLALAAALFGSMKVAIIVLAAGLALHVWLRPKEAAPAGVLYLLACNVLLPSSARYGWSQFDNPWQMRYWAAGLLIITWAAAARIGIRTLWRIPASLKAFLAVAFLAGFVGMAHGNEPSYVIRQLYGSVLLAAYFAIAYHMGDEEFFLRRLRTYGLLCAAGFFVYYAVEFSELGFHKEITALGTLEGAAAILCFNKGLTEKRRGWMVSALVLLAVPFLLFERRDLITFAVAIALGLAIRTSSRKRRYLYVAAAVLGTLPGVLVSSAGFILEKMQSVPRIEEALPGGGTDIKSLVDRTIQLGIAVDTLRVSPALGAGFGAEIIWDRPRWQEIMQQAYIDNGWAYLAVKMGGVGILAFGWFLATTLRCVSRKSSGLSACFLSVVLVTSFTEPVFFNFNTSAMLGAISGLLCAGRTRAPATEVVTVCPEDHPSFHPQPVRFPKGQSSLEIRRMS